MTMVVFGQALRSTAMIQAATNFSHSLAFKKEEKHRLVTTGVYA
jgi:protein-S-isoprenylcysteine O-methyltransferase